MLTTLKTTSLLTQTKRLILTETASQTPTTTIQTIQTDLNRTLNRVVSASSTQSWPILALLIICGLGAVLVVRRNQNLPENNSPFATQSHGDTATEAFMNDESAKDLPAIETESQQWEENGVNWSKSADGSLYYYDNETGQWIPYQAE